MDNKDDMGYVGAALIVVCIVLIAITWLDVWQPVLNLLANIWQAAQ